ncbi:hypothetical protein BS78_07G006500 [Paspalum vaginatum]|nr:hypothetical protein BS78_07G006500 [Paspalum vaginatum]
MAVPPRAMAGHQEQEHEDVGGEEEFTFPTPPQPPLLFGKDFASSPPPAWLLSSPIRRSFSAADCAASPWRVARRQRLHGACSPALSDYDAAGGFCFDDDAEEEEERMDSLWEDLNDHDAAAAARLNDGLLFLGSSLDVSRRRSVAGERVANKDQRAGPGVPAGAQAALGSSRSSRRRPPGLVVMMRALKRMFVAHKGKSRVHRDEQSTASALASASSCSSSNNPSKSKTNKG